MRHGKVLAVATVLFLATTCGTFAKGGTSHPAPARPVVSRPVVSRPAVSKPSTPTSPPVSRAVSGSRTMASTDSNLLFWMNTWQANAASHRSNDAGKENDDQADSEGDNFYVKCAVVGITILIGIVLFVVLFALMLL